METIKLDLLNNPNKVQRNYFLKDGSIINLNYDRNIFYETHTLLRFVMMNSSSKYRFFNIARKENINITGKISKELIIDGILIENTWTKEKMPLFAICHISYIYDTGLPIAKIDLNFEGFLNKIKDLKKNLNNCIDKTS